ncbi:hypothetical protein HFK74_18430|uniref:hypothetical protein n=1 Tax=Pseudomonas sp. SbOxS1 TaxID=2723884 RepID=UPI0015D24B22|nr:hypothetical protein [Pseudomonas sp. SbOxS1]NYU04675.1 hypothetical protein [Pseudomonas sp. SbOxS1]
MLLKNLASVSFGVLLSLKAWADDKALYSADLTHIESNENKLIDEQSSYKICTDYRVDDFFAFDAAALGPANQTAIFGSKIAPCKLQSLVELTTSDTYVFAAALELMRESST